VSTAFISSRMESSPISLFLSSRAATAEPLTIGMSSPGYSYLDRSSRTSSSTSSSSSGSSTQIDLVQIHHNRRHADLAGQKNVLTGLRHRAVGSRHHQDGAVHLGGTGDHVLDVVGVAGQSTWA